MFHLCTKLAAFSLLVTILTVLVAPALGHLQPPNPALHGFIQNCDGQPQPCWYGIVPGVTTVNEAVQMLNYQSLGTIERRRPVWTLIYRNTNMNCSVQIRHEQDVIHSITITGCLDVRLGDLVTTLGTPERILPFSLTFVDETISVETDYQIVQNDSCLNLTPYGSIVEMQIKGQGVGNNSEQPGIWQGFLPYGWYVQRGAALSCADLARLS